MVNAETEIRKLRPKELCSLAGTLSPDSWKLLMGIIPKDGSQNLPMFTKEHLDIIESTGLKQRRLPAEIFLEEWSTMGRKRPTIRRLIDFLVQVELFRAADYLATEILKEEPPKRPQNGPAAPIDIFVNFDEVPDNQVIAHQVNGFHGTQEENYAAPSINNDNLQHVYEEEKCHAEEVSKFPFNSKSDLMQFSSNSLPEEKSNDGGIKYGEEQEEIVLPNFEELNLHCNQGGVSNRGKMTPEKSSDSALTDSSDVSTGESSCRTSSSQDTVHTKDSIYLSDDLPVILREINRQKTTGNLREDNATNNTSTDYCLSEDSYSNLPLPILELCKR